MAGESFFVPSTAWGAELATAPLPSFLPGEPSPAWLHGAAEVRQLVMTAEPVITLLYLAGYAIPEIVIGVGEPASQWVTFDPSDVRIRPGSRTWDDHIGSNHPGDNARVVAIRADPMPHRRRPLDPAGTELGPQVPLALTIGATTLTATHGGWVVLDLTPTRIAVELDAAREQLLQPVVDAVTHFQAARTTSTPIGLAGIYDPSNWQAVASAPGAATAAADRVETLRHVILFFTKQPSPWSNDNDPTTQGLVERERVRSLLEEDIPHPNRPRVKVDQVLGWNPMTVRLAEMSLGIRDKDKDAFLVQLASLKRLGGDASVQGLTSAILDFHHRGLVNVLDHLSAPDVADPCGRAIDLALGTAKLKPDDVEIMCACLAHGIMADSHKVAGRLVTEYPLLYADADSRAAIRLALIGACEAAESHNSALNDSRVAATVDTNSAEHFAGLLATALTSEPRKSTPGFDRGLYVNPLLEVADAWARWVPLLDGLPSSNKLIALTCTVFRDCGHPEVCKNAALRVVNRYSPGLTALHRGTADDPGHHWSHVVHGDEFQGWGSTEVGREGWREQILLDLLKMLVNTHEGSELHFLNDHDSLLELVGRDPLATYDVDAFESAYADLLGKSKDDPVPEYVILLGLTGDYADTTSEAQAGRYNVAALSSRFAELVADPDLRAHLEALREEAFVSVENEWLSLENLRMDIDAYITSERHHLLLLCFDDDERIAYQEALIDRVRRRVPGSERGGGRRIRRRVLRHRVLFADRRHSRSRADRDAQGCREDPRGGEPKLSRYVAKVLKEGPVGLPKAYLSVAQKASIDVTTFADDVAVAVRRKELWDVMIASGPTEPAITKYLNGVDNVRGIPVDAASSVGHAMTFLVAGIVLWQMSVEGPPTRPDSILSMSRDLAMTVPAALQLGALAVRYFGNREAQRALILAVETLGSFLTKLSTFITLLANTLLLLKYIADGDVIGMLLLATATVASVVAFAATVGVVTAPVGAIAATVAAILMVIDTARLVLEKVHHLWQELVIDPRLKYAPTVDLLTPHRGEFAPAVGLAVEAEVTLIGEVAFPGHDDEEIETHDAIVDWGIGTGIRTMHAAVELVSGGFTVSSPIPAVVSGSAALDETSRPLFEGDSLLVVRPRFESWVEAPQGGFDPGSMLLTVGERGLRRRHRRHVRRRVPSRRARRRRRCDRVSERRRCHACTRSHLGERAMSGPLDAIAVAAVRTVLPLSRAMTDGWALRTMLREMGWAIDLGAPSTTRCSPPSRARPRSSPPSRRPWSSPSSWSTAPPRPATSPARRSRWCQELAPAIEAWRAFDPADVVADATSALAKTSFWTELALDLPEYLLLRYLRDYQGVLRGVLRVLGVIVDEVRQSPFLVGADPARPPASGLCGTTSRRSSPTRRAPARPSTAGRPGEEIAHQRLVADAAALLRALGLTAQDRADRRRVRAGGAGWLLPAGPPGLRPARQLRLTVAHSADADDRRHLGGRAARRPRPHRPSSAADGRRFLHRAASRPAR